MPDTRSWLADRVASLIPAASAAADCPWVVLESRCSPSVQSRVQPQRFVVAPLFVLRRHVVEQHRQLLHMTGGMTVAGRRPRACRCCWQAPNQ